MYLFNKVRNFININPVARRLFVKFISPFTVPLLILQNYLSIKGYRRRRSISLWKKNNPKNILRYKNGMAFNISKNKSSVSKSLVFQKDYSDDGAQHQHGIIFRPEGGFAMPFVPFRGVGSHAEPAQYQQQPVFFPPGREVISGSELNAQKSGKLADF